MNEAASGQSAGSERRTQAIIGTVMQSWFRSEWTAYATSFVRPDGRIVDNANGMASHSEGQGYGLLLAAFAADPERFDVIWRWTERNLKVREDDLLSWKWDPTRGSVADLNNATDGDLLVAWGLAEGGRRFHRPDYLECARTLAKAILAETITSNDAGTILMPAAAGFGAEDQPDGPVINLSYWVFPAFSTLNELWPSPEWRRLHVDGLRVLDNSRFGPFGLPTDWQSSAGASPKPAKSFPARFGYDAIRIPLYLAWDDDPASMRALKRFAALSATATKFHPSARDIAEGVSVQPFDGSGYQVVFDLARCATAGTPIHADLIKSRDRLYYPETLRLLSLALIKERFSRCL